MAASLILISLTRPKAIIVIIDSRPTGNYLVRLVVEYVRQCGIKLHLRRGLASRRTRERKNCLHSRLVMMKIWALLWDLSLYRLFLVSIQRHFESVIWKVWLSVSLALILVMVSSIGLRGMCSHLTEMRHCYSSKIVNPSLENSLRTAKKWLDTCLRTHSLCRSEDRDWLPTMLLDIKLDIIRLVLSNEVPQGS